MIRGRASVWLVAAGALAASAIGARAQDVGSPGHPIAMDSTGLGEGRYAAMSMLYEKTLFAVDVLRLTVHLGVEDTRRIEKLVEGRRHSKQLADSIARIAIDSRDAFVRSVFQRDVNQGQFFDGVRKNLRKAVKAGIIDESAFELVSNGLPVWYDFLAERGIKDGDRILYRIRGDTLRTQYVAFDGEVLRDQTDVGPERRLAVLGSYYAPKSDFREKLVKSLFDDAR